MRKMLLTAKAGIRVAPGASVPCTTKHWGYESLQCFPNPVGRIPNRPRLALVGRFLRAVERGDALARCLCGNVRSARLDAATAMSPRSITTRHADGRAATCSLAAVNRDDTNTARESE